MTKKDRVIKSIEIIETKIKNLQEKLKNLYDEKKKIEDTEILQAVHSIEVTPEELQKILFNIKMSKYPIETMTSNKNNKQEYRKNEK